MHRENRTCLSDQYSGERVQGSAYQQQKTGRHSFLLLGAGFSQWDITGGSVDPSSHKRAVTASGWAITGADMGCPNRAAHIYVGRFKNMVAQIRVIEHVVDLDLTVRGPERHHREVQIC